MQTVEFKPELVACFLAGKHVGKLLFPALLNPYPAGTEAHAEWRRGHCEGMDEINGAGARC